MDVFNLTVLIIALVAMLLHLSTTAFAPSSNSKWLTLDGSPPLVIARGGFSGLYPDSSAYAFDLAASASVSDVIMWCDMHLTKDGIGFCFPDMKLDNSSNIAYFYPNRRNTYDVNGVKIQGYFPIDFTLKEIKLSKLRQGIYSRSPIFDDLFDFQTIDDVSTINGNTKLWLNVQYNMFYSQHNLSMRSYVVNASKRMNITHISSAEVSFLQELAQPFASQKTKLVFRFLDKNEKEQSTNQTYGSLLRNLTMIKDFASGILVPKGYIWPVDDTLYLLPHTSLVADAHKLGLQVFAADFANDFVFAYNYSYNPVVECLAFIGNGNFSVDGLVSDFPVTPSEARDCLVQVETDAPTLATPLVISHHGASGDFPDCSDIAYTQAIEGGADILDCPVQMSTDGIPFCYNTEFGQSKGRLDNSTDTSTAKGPSVLAFSLSWAAIQALKPGISAPFSNYLLYRNPKFKDSGKIVSLAHFLDIAKNATSLSGVLIKIENVRYLAENKGQDIIGAILDALDNAGYNRFVAKKVMIQSTSSSTLKAMIGRRYELVYEINELISGTQNDAITYIKTFADSVIVGKNSIIPSTIDSFTTNMTTVVSDFHSYQLAVYVQIFRNEFVSQAFDFLSDPMLEISTFVAAAKVDGIITDFPTTAALYKINHCQDTSSFSILPVEPGTLLQSIYLNATPPLAPLLTVEDVSEPPLPTPKVPAAESPMTPNSKYELSPNKLVSTLAIITMAFLPLI